MAFITASSNPVGVYSANVGKDITIRWDTQLRGVNGRVSVLINGTPNPPELGGQLPSGNATYKVTIPNTYTFVLRRTDNNAELQRLDVTTYDLRDAIIAGFAGAYVPALRPQMITHLSVKPGVDTVRISFRTARPTIPKTEIRDDKGNYVDGRMPLFGGLRTRHEAVFGIERPLALNKKHSFRIEAFGPTRDLGNPNKPANPNNAVVTGEFVTGTRNVDVMYENLDVHDDGDSGGPGEFALVFAVGNVETGAMLGNPHSMRRDISDKDRPIDLGIVLPLTDVHREIWLQVIAHEDDHDIFEGLGIGARGMRPEFNGPGGRYKDDGSQEMVTLTIVEDVDLDPGRWMVPFELRTGDWPVDFVVTGHLRVHIFEGSTIATKIARAARVPRGSGFLTEPGSVAGLDVGGVGERTEEVALGGDGAFYHRSLRRERSKTEGGGDWTRVELPGRGTPAVVSAGETLDLFDLDERGGVLHRRYDPDKPRGAKWCKMGGNFAHVVPAAEPGKGKGSEHGLTLFGIAEDGDLFVRDARGEGRDWERLGDQSVSAVAPVSAGRAGASLFAISGDGALLHCSKERGRWRSRAIGPPPGRVPTLLLTAAAFGRTDGKGVRGVHDVVIGALGQDHIVRILRWPGYPEGSPTGRWEEMGPLQDLVTGGQGRAPTKRKAPSKPRRQKHKATPR